MRQFFKDSFSNSEIEQTLQDYEKKLEDTENEILEQIYFNSDDNDDEDDGNNMTQLGTKSNVIKKNTQSKTEKIKNKQMNEIESEFILFNNKTQISLLKSQIKRILSSIYNNQYLIAQISNICLSLLKYFEKTISNHSLYFFLSGNIILQELGINWSSVSPEKVRQGLLNLSMNLLGQEMTDDFLFSLLHLLIKSFIKMFFNKTVENKDLQLVRTVNEHYKARNEEIEQIKNEFEEKIKSQMNTNTSANLNMYSNFASSKKMAKSTHSFNISSSFKINFDTGKNKILLDSRNHSINEVKKEMNKQIFDVTKECEEDLRFYYFQMFKDWKKKDKKETIKNSHFINLMQKDNFYVSIKEILGELNIVYFYLFQNFFVYHLLDVFLFQNKKSISNFSNETELPINLSKLKIITSRLGNWPFILSLQGFKTVKTTGNNVVRNLIFGDKQLKHTQEKSIFKWAKSKIEKLFITKNKMKIEINITGKDIQKKVNHINQRFEEKFNFMYSMKKSFPKNFAMTDILYNQIAIGLQKSLPYVLKIDIDWVSRLKSKVLGFEVYYRIDSEFSQLGNNMANRYFLKNKGKDLWGLKAKKCGLRGCYEDSSVHVSVKKTNIKEIRSQLGVSSTDGEDFDIPTGN